MYTTVIYITFERGISYFIILKLFKFSGFHTKIVFKQSFKYLKNEKINLSKVIIKLECLFYLNIYILLYLILYSKSHLTQTNPKKGLIEKKTCQINKNMRTRTMIMILPQKSLLCRVRSTHNDA